MTPTNPKKIYGLLADKFSQEIAIQQLLQRLQKPALIVWRDAFSCTQFT